MGSGEGPGGVSRLRPGGLCGAGLGHLDGDGPGGPDGRPARWRRGAPLGLSQFQQVTRGSPAPLWPPLRGPTRSINKWGRLYPGLGYPAGLGHPRLGNACIPDWDTWRLPVLGNSPRCSTIPMRFLRPGKAKPRAAGTVGVSGAGDWKGPRRQSPARVGIVGSCGRGRARLHVSRCRGTASADLSPSRHRLPAGHARRRRYSGNPPQRHREAHGLRPGEGWASPMHAASGGFLATRRP